ncbi:MAG: bifunctional aldolase/short-chain dehydrogenase [Planctomycetota bacterium]
MESRWDDAEGAALESRDLLAYVSRLLGREGDLVLCGGGNTSVKVRETDPLGREVELLCIKPSGADLAAVRAQDFTPLRLADLLPLRERDAMDDDEMVDLVLRAAARPGAARPSIETLLHAFLPHRFVLHSHADALLALGNRLDGEERLRDVLGPGVAIVAYRRPGFRLGREVAEACGPAARACVLLKHGLVTFGDDARAAYEHHLELVTRCEQALPLPPLPEPPPPDRDRAAAVAPRLRGALGRHRVLLFDDEAEVRAFVADRELLARTQRGPATADHILRTKRVPCVVREVGDVARYAEAGGARGDRPDLDPAPRVLLAPGLGMWTAGRTLEEARVVHEIYLHTMRILRRAGEGWEPISPQDARHAEDWPLQHAKLRPAAGELAGRVAWISGAAGAIGRAVARRFAAEGAHLVLCDVDEEGVRAVAGELGVRACPVVCDVSDEAQVRRSFRRARLGFGGVDVVVSNAGVAHSAPIDELDPGTWRRSLEVNATAHFLVARAALPILKEQGLGGSFVFVASKNVPAPGAGFAAYSAAKAAETQLARVLALEAAPFGVRVNVLHPDAVFEGSRLWSDEVRRERARVHGVAVTELEEFYARRNLLRVRVRADDVAEAALFFASARSSRTTGATLAVDGGVRDAFPR